MSSHAVSELDVSDDKHAQAEPSAEERQRIADLEAEVAKLRQQLGAAERGGLVATRGGAGLALSADEAKLDLNQKAGLKAVLIAVAVVALSLGLIVGVYSALATGFDAFAKKAAETIVGGEDDAPENAVGGGVAIDPSVVGVGKAASTPETKQKPSPAKEAPAGKGKVPIQIPGL